MRADLAVVVVSDFESGAKSWEDERRAVDALLGQDLDAGFDIVIAEHEVHASSVPDDLRDHEGVRFVFGPSPGSAELKDLAVGHTTADLVGVIEADCVPDRSWVRRLRAVLDERSDIAVVSGRTVYGDATRIERALTVLDRGFDDLGESGPSTTISNNGALYRREVLERFSYPPAVTPFASAMQRNAQIRRAGHRFWFEREATMTHAIGGFDFVRDLRRNRGYAAMQSLGSRRFRSIPRLLARRARHDLRDIRRVGPRQLRGADWLVLAAAWAAARPLEVPGMVDRIRRRSEIPGSAYR